MVMKKHKVSKENAKVSIIARLHYIRNIVNTRILGFMGVEHILGTERHNLIEIKEQDILQANHLEEVLKEKQIESLVNHLSN